jgi:signal transduction histidine kinase
MSLIEFLATLVTPTALMLAVWAAVRASHGRRVAEADLARLSGGLLKMLEAEQARIARELHDDISQQLAVVGLELDAIQSEPEGASDRFSSALASLAQRVRSVAADVQQVTRGLHPARLEYIGLVPSVRALCHDMEHYGLTIEVSQRAWPDQLPAAVALSLYRVSQEALHNAAKHSGAHEIRVKFEGYETNLQVTVSDDGIGFDTRGVDTVSGFGMMSMRQRLRAIGGSLIVHSAPGQGTQIEAMLPRFISLPKAETKAAETRHEHNLTAVL